MEFVQKLFAKPTLAVAAIIFGAFVVIADVVLFGALLGREPNFSEPVVLAINGMVAAPFLWLAYRGSTRLLPWLTGMTLTLWLWWRWLEKGVAYQRSPDGSGVDMAGALLMLISPLLIGVVCAWLDEVLRQFCLVRAEANNGQPLSLFSALAIAPGRATGRWKHRAGEMWRQF